MNDVRHVFVLMLENRSFDHFFGLSGLPGITPPDSAKWSFKDGATDRVTGDPGHELADVAYQTAPKDGVPMKGFETMQYFEEATAGFGSLGVPVVRALAKEFLLFDNWFSSMPGPTWPNRFFVHAGSSGGLTNSPSGWTSFQATHSSDCAFSFENGTVFDRLEKAGRKWRVYHAGIFPQVLAVSGMLERHVDPAFFRDLNVGGQHDPFATDLNGAYAVDYTFIEPDHGIPFGNGDSQHAPFSVAKGERLIKYVYETLRGSPIWAQSALLVTWDEHGGFFDQVDAPPATPPGDRPVNHGREAVKPSDFDFSRFGVRVPALLISPWVGCGGLGSTLFPRATFDHASVVRSLREQFELGPALTQRDAAAPSWQAAFTQTMARTNCLTQLPDPGVAAAMLAMAPSGPAEPLEAPPSQATVDGYLLIARSIDLLMTERKVIPQSIASEHPATLRYTATIAAPGVDAAIAEPSVDQKLDYIRQVAVARMKANALHPKARS